MTIEHFIQLTQVCREYSAEITFHTAKSVVYFSLPQEFNEEELHVTSLSTGEISDKYNAGMTAEQIVVEMLDWLTDHTCERCEQVSEDDFVQAADDYICIECYEGMIDDAEYAATLDSMRGWI